MIIIAAALMQVFYSFFSSGRIGGCDLEVAWEILIILKDKFD